MTYSQVVETEIFKHFFCSYFKVVHDFIKCSPTFVRSGIVSKVSKVRNIVLKKKITSMLNSRGPSVNYCGTPCIMSLQALNEEPALVFCDLPLRQS